MARQVRDRAFPGHSELRRPRTVSPGQFRVAMSGLVRALPANPNRPIDTQEIRGPLAPCRCPSLSGVDPSSWTGSPMRQSGSAAPPQWWKRPNPGQPVRARLPALLICAPGRIRTCDARFRKPTLYPLSYGGGAGDRGGRTAASPEGGPHRRGRASRPSTTLPTYLPLRPGDRRPPAVSASPGSRRRGRSPGAGRAPAGLPPPATTRTPRRTRAR